MGRRFATSGGLLGLLRWIVRQCRRMFGQCCCCSMRWKSVAMMWKAASGRWMISAPPQASMPLALLICFRAIFRRVRIGMVVEMVGSCWCGQGICRASASCWCWADGSVGHQIESTFRNIFSYYLIWWEYPQYWLIGYPWISLNNMCVRISSILAGRISLNHMEVS